MPLHSYHPGVRLFRGSSQETHIYLAPYDYVLESASFIHMEEHALTETQTSE